MDALTLVDFALRLFGLNAPADYADETDPERGTKPIGG
jgi:hypothetical protein